MILSISSLFGLLLNKKPTSVKVNTLLAFLYFHIGAERDVKTPT